MSNLQTFFCASAGGAVEVGAESVGVDWATVLELEREVMRKRDYSSRKLVVFL